MIPPTLLVGAACLPILGAYAALDWSLRREQARRAPLGVRLLVAMGLVSAIPFWHWGSVAPCSVPGGNEVDAVRILAFALVCATTWNAITRDYEIVASGPNRVDRLVALVCAASAWFSPAAFLLATIGLSMNFRFWQHHASYPMRVLLMLGAFELARALSLPLAPLLSALPEPGTSYLAAALLVLLTTLLTSHYLITALAKVALGPRPWSWVTANRLHYLAASAYSWGWARFVSWPRYRRFVLLLRRLEVPLQAIVFLLECSIAFSFLDGRLTGAFCLAFFGFHLGVFLVSGLLFWDWMVTNLLLALAFFAAPAELESLAFGPSSLALGWLLLLLFPLRHKLWKPMPLGWYDSPLTQRIHYRVHGSSGTRYGLYNNFMCPHERIYGKVHGCFAYAGSVLTYHLGEVFKLEVRDAILRAGPNSQKLELVKQQYGIEPWSSSMTQAHMAYLKDYFGRLNQGAKKGVLPGWLSWLKAPGDQLFYWGDLPAYRRQEPVISIELVYREEYFDGAQPRCLADEVILTIPISPGIRQPSGATLPAGPQRPGPRELTPRELDDHLLELARGRLLDLPNFKRKFLSGDDGPSLGAPSLAAPPLGAGETIRS